MTQLLLSCLQDMIYGSLFLLLVWVITISLGKRLSSSVRCWLWWLVCLKFLSGLVWTSPVSLPLLPASPVAEITETTIPAVVKTPVTNPPPPAVSPPQADAPAPMPEQTSSQFPWDKTLLLIWALGIAFRSSIHLQQILRTRRLVSLSHSLNDANILQAASEISATAELKRSPEIRTIDADIAPFATGLRKPVVLITRTDLSRLEESELRPLLAHEIAHLKRGDLWLGIIPLLCETILWFFPLSYLACRAYETEREIACDDVARSMTSSAAHAYGNLLFKLSASPTAPQRAGALSVTSYRFAQLKRRVSMLQQPPVSMMGSRVRRLVGFTSALLGMAFVPWRLIAAAPSPANSNSPRNLSFEAGLTGWEKTTGKGDTTFRVTSDTSVKSAGRASVRLESNHALDDTSSLDRAGDFLSQKFSASAFAGKRIRFSAALASRNMSSNTGGGIWVRIDGPNWQKAWNHLLGVAQRTQGWSRATYTFTVPKDAKAIEIGADLMGKGTLWIDDVCFETLPKSTSVALMEPDYDSERSGGSNATNSSPRNLNFAQGLQGWGTTGNGDDEPNPYYSVGVDQTVQYQGQPSGFLMASVAHPLGYGALRQDVDADAYQGKRIRFSTYIKTVGTKAEAGPLLSIVTPRGSRTYTLTSTPILGNTEWKRYTFVADVPDNATWIMLGLSLRGAGKVYGSGFQLETVGKDVPLSPIPQMDVSDSLPTSPQNLHFQQGLSYWGKANPEGDAPDYAIGLDKTAGRTGGPAAYLAATKANPNGYGTLLSYFIPDVYRGKRIRFSTYMRTENAQAAGMWLRLDRPDGKTQAWNRASAPIRGTTDWKRYEYVLNVPSDSQGINFGLDLTGKGKIWTDGFNFEVVGNDVPTSPDIQ